MKKNNRSLKDRIFRRELKQPQNREQLRIIRHMTPKNSKAKIIDEAETPQHALIGKKIGEYTVKAKNALIKGLLLIFR